MSTTYITIKIGRLPGKISEITLNGDRTIETALKTASLDANGYEVRVNGSPVASSHVLQNGDLVLLVKKIKGNSNGYIEVKAGIVPSPKPLQTFALEFGSTISELLAIAEFKIDTLTIFKNDEVAQLNEELNDGDTVILKLVKDQELVEDDNEEVENDQQSETETAYEENPQALREQAQKLRLRANVLYELAYALEGVQRFQQAQAKAAEARKKLTNLG